MFQQFRPQMICIGVLTAIGLSASAVAQGEFPIIHTPGGQTAPALAYSPEADAFLLAYRSGAEGSNTGGIRAQRLDPSAQPDGGESVLSSDPLDMQPELAANDGVDDFLVVWARAATNATSQDIVGQIIGTGPPNPARPVSARRGLQRKPAIAHCPSSGSYMVVWDEDLDAAADFDFHIYRQHVDHSGVPIGSPAPVSADYPRPAFQQINADIAYNARRNEYLVVNRDARFPDRGSGNNDDIFGQRLSCAGVPQLDDDLPISTQASPAPGGNSQERPAIAYEAIVIT